MGPDQSRFRNLQAGSCRPICSVPASRNARRPAGIDRTMLSTGNRPYFLPNEVVPRRFIMTVTTHATVVSVHNVEQAIACESAIALPDQTSNSSGLSSIRMGSGLVSLTKAVLIIGATMVAGLMPSAALGQVKLLAKPPVSPESLALS